MTDHMDDIENIDENNNINLNNNNQEEYQEEYQEQDQYTSPVEFPTDDEIINFIKICAVAPNKRDLIKEFQLEEHRELLKETMERLKEEEKVLGNRKGYMVEGGQVTFERKTKLPPTAMLEVYNVDKETGEVLMVVADTNDKEESASEYKISLHITERHEETNFISGMEIFCKLIRKNDGTYKAKIIKVLEREPDEYIFGILKDGVLEPVQRAWRNWDIRLNMQKAENQELSDGMLLKVLIERRKSSTRSAIVSLAENFGDVSGKKIASEITLARHNIPQEFPTDALKQAEDSQAPTLEHRTDIRDIPLVTIDGEDARDFDDAVFAKETDDGWELVVAIADVSAYVTPNSPLDVEAQKRGNSVYLPDRVVPMLPTALSNGWCSLNPKEDRGALVAFINIDDAGNIKSSEIKRCLMQSHARLTYKQVQEALDNENANDEVESEIYEKSLLPIFGAYKALCVNKNARGTLNINTNEYKVAFNDDNSVEDITQKESYESNKIIEEFMVTANVVTAQTLEKLKQPCMYRVHPSPSYEKIQSLSNLLFGLEMDYDFYKEEITPKDFNAVIELAKDTEYADMINMMVLRSQSQAMYSPENEGHFGLYLEKYAHFTSPIRRYSDLLVHRALIKGLKLEINNDGLPEDMDEEFYDISAHISKTERIAAKVERETVERYGVELMKDRLHEEFQAKITGITSSGLFVEIPIGGIEGLVPLRTLPYDYYNFDQDTKRYIGQATGVKYSLGDSVPVKLIEVEVLLGGLLFEILPDTRFDDVPEDILERAKNAKSSGVQRRHEGDRDRGSRGGFGGRDRDRGSRGGFGGDRDRGSRGGFGGDRDRGSRGGFGGDRDRGSRGGFGGDRDRGSRGGFGGDRDRGSRGGFGGDRDRGSRGGFGGDRDRGSRGGFGGDRDRGSRGGFGGDRDRGLRGGFGGDRDRGSRGGFGGDRDRGSRGGFGGDRDRGSRGGFGGDRDRGSRGGFGGDRDRGSRGGFGGDRDRGSRGGFGGDRDRGSRGGFGGDRDRGSRGGFGGDRDRGSRGGFGGDRDRGSRGGFGGDRDRGSRGGFGGDRDRGSRGGFGGDRDRGSRGGFGGDRDRGSRGGFGGDRDRGSRGGFGGDRDRGSRGGFGGDRDRGSRGGFGGDRDRGSRGGFGGDRDRGSRGGFGGDRDRGSRGGFGGDRERGSRGGFGGDRERGSQDRSPRSGKPDDSNNKE